MKSELQLLNDLHEICKEHPYRLGTDRTVNSAKSYVKYLEKLREEFDKQVDKYCEKQSIPNPIKTWLFDHQFISCYYLLPYRTEHKNTKNDSYIDSLIMIDGYIQCVHHFLNTNGVLTYLFMDVGYSTDSNSSWIINPRRAIHLVYYPTLNEWNYDEYHLKQEIKYLKLQRTHYTKEIKEQQTEGKNTEFHIEHLNWVNKKIDKLTALLKQLLTQSFEFKVNVEGEKVNV